jgi:hypothetical protein
VVDGLLVKVLGWDDLLDDLLLDLLPQQLSGDVLAVLGADDNGVHPDRDNGPVIMLVLNGNLGLGVRSEPREAAVPSCSRHGSVKLVGQLESQWEELWGLIGSVSEHDALITSAELLEGLFVVQALGDVGGLLLNGNQDITGLVVKALGGVVVSNVLDRISDDLLVIDTCLGRDLTKDHDHTGLRGGFARNLGEGVFL